MSELLGISSMMEAILLVVSRRLSSYGIYRLKSECLEDHLTSLSGTWEVKFDGQRCITSCYSAKLADVH